LLSIGLSSCQVIRSPFGKTLYLPVILLPSGKSWEAVKTKKSAGPLASVVHFITGAEVSVGEQRAREYHLLLIP
jgi:hypothetical protein